MESGQKISSEFAELINIVNAAVWHKKNCNESCNVSLLQLKWTATRLVPFLWSREIEEAVKLIADTDWS
mgnify:CR=1 FL=1